MKATLSNIEIGSKIQTGYGVLEVTGKNEDKKYFTCNLILKKGVLDSLLHFETLTNPHYKCELIK